jgi:SNF2 family DNA or RNA helicase
MHEKIRHEIRVRSFERSQILVLDALLKSRQVCCDPRLVKLEAARDVTGNAKLAALMEMLGELASEGWGALVVSEFTQMLDLLAPEVDKAGIEFVELDRRRLKLVGTSMNTPKGRLRKPMKRSSRQGARGQL